MGGRGETKRRRESPRRERPKETGRQEEENGERRRETERHRDKTRWRETQRQERETRDSHPKEDKINARRQTGQMEVGVIQGGLQGWRKTGCSPDPQYLEGPRSSGEKGEKEPPLPTSLQLLPTHQPSSAHPTTDGNTEAGTQASLILLSQPCARLPTRDLYHQVKNGNGSGFFFFFPLRKS